VTWRKAFRDFAKTGMRTDPYFSAFTELPSWAQDIDAGTLPVWSVMTPREQIDSQNKDELRRTFDLTVTMARAGGDDVDDILDADALAAEAAVMPTLKSAGLYAEMAGVATRMAGEGARRLGEIELTITCIVETTKATPA